MTRRPTAFNLDEVRFEPEELYPGAEAEENAALEKGLTVPVQLRRPRRWLGVFFAAVGGLVTLAIILISVAPMLWVLWRDRAVVVGGTDRG